VVQGGLGWGAAVQYTPQQQGRQGWARPAGWQGAPPQHTRTDSMQGLGSGSAALWHTRVEGAGLTHGFPPHCAAAGVGWRMRWRCARRCARRGRRAGPPPTPQNKHWALPWEAGRRTRLEQKNMACRTLSFKTAGWLPTTLTQQWRPHETTGACGLRAGSALVSSHRTGLPTAATGRCHALCGSRPSAGA